MQLTTLDTSLLEIPPPELALHIVRLLSDQNDKLVTPTDMFTPEISLKYVLRRFENISEAIDQLQNEHAANYIYRGQTRRHIGTYEGVVPEMQDWLSAGSRKGDVLFKIHTDSLVPSYYRSNDTTLTMPGIHHVNQAVRCIYQARQPLWDKVLSAHLRRFLNQDTLPVLAAIAKLGAIPGVNSPITYDTGNANVSDGLLRLISLSQHYELSSVMVDFSKDIHVGSWFATHSWTGEPVFDGEAVIYRLNLEKFRTTIGQLFPSGSSAFMLRLLYTILGYADISEEPKELGLRPSAQSGFSVLGLENAIAYLLLDYAQALELFIFPLNQEAWRISAIAKQDLCPPDDPALNVLAATKLVEKPIGFFELLDFMARNGFSKEEFQSVQTAFKMGLL